MKALERVAVVGHVEHVTLGRVGALPAAGGIAHLADACVLPGGGGAIAFFQLTRVPASCEVHFFTAIGDDEAGRTVARRLATLPPNVHVHAARRTDAHTRDVVMVTPDGERTIVVVGEPLQPTMDDALPWDVLGTCDSVYFTAQDPRALVACRSARTLVVTARRREALVRSGVVADVVVGSVDDPRECFARCDYPTTPRALVLTAGAKGGTIETSAGTAHFRAPVVTRAAGGGSYGAGDSFAGALAYYAATGIPMRDACERAAEHGAAVLAGIDPLAHQRALG